MSALERRPEHVSLFNGATPDDITAAATEVSTRFSDIVKRQRMFKRIGDRDHILIEAWQTLATLTGVAATEAGGVLELPWPSIEQLTWIADEPPLPGKEPRNKETEAWEAWKAADELHKSFAHHQAIAAAHALGKAWGFTAAFRAVKDGREIGWGEGRVDRSERTWAGRDDYALASMAQTRGQSRALGAPLRFIVKLAGYEPTLPDDLPEPSEPTAAAPVGQWGEVTDKDEALQTAADAVRAATGADGERFIAALAQNFDGIPVACVTMLRGLARYVSDQKIAAAETTTDAEVVA